MKLSDKIEYAISDCDINSDGTAEISAVHTNELRDWLQEVLTMEAKIREYDKRAGCPF